MVTQLACPTPPLSKHCNGVALFTRRPRDYPDSLSSCDTGPRVGFCDLADGGLVAVELRRPYDKGWKAVRAGPSRREVSPVVAVSFAEVLGRALGSGGRPDRPEPAG